MGRTIPSVKARWERERPQLQALPRQPFDTAYYVKRQASLDAYVAYQGCRYSVPGHLAGEPLSLRVTLDGQLSIHHANEGTVGTHSVSRVAHDTVLDHTHHAALWADLKVSERDLSDYVAHSGEVASWN